MKCGSSMKNVDRCSTSHADSRWMDALFTHVFHTLSYDIIAHDPENEAGQEKV